MAEIHRSGRQGGSMELGPNLYKQARCKYRTVHKELQNWNWIKNIRSTDSSRDYG
jgi:hypothetical protein